MLNVTEDQFFFELNLSGPENPTIVDSANTASGGQNGFLTIYDPSLNPSDPNYEGTTTDIAPSELPEPAGVSLLAISTIGLYRRRSR